MPRTDYILTVQDGRIAERGTYNELIGNDGPFAKFVAQFGGQDEEIKEVKDAAEEEALEGADKPDIERKAARAKERVKGKTLMQTEERATGAVSGTVYHQYLQ